MEPKQASAKDSRLDLILRIALVLVVPLMSWQTMLLARLEDRVDANERRYEQLDERVRSIQETRFTREDGKDLELRITNDRQMIVDELKRCIIRAARGENDC